MKIKTILAITLITACCCNAFGQLSPQRGDRQRIIRSVREELKDVWPEPETSLEQLANRAVRGDPQALYALSMMNSLDWQKRKDYLNRAAKAGYVKAQLRVAFKLGCEDYSGDIDELRTARKYCENAVRSGYLCATNIIPFIEERTVRREKADQDRAREKEERARMEEALQRATAKLQQVEEEKNSSTKAIEDEKRKLIELEKRILEARNADGLTYATNDIARLERAIAKCRERIAAETEAKARGADALNLLVDEDTKKAEAAKQKEIEAKQKEDEERRQQYEKEREYWSTWPRTLSDEEMALLDRDFEKKFNCVFLDNSGPLLTDNKLCESEHRRANTWLQGSGKSLIVFYDEFFQKINPNGLIVAWGLSRYQTDLEELKWYEEEKEKRLRLSRGKWAQDRGMTLEEASQKFKEWTESNPRPRPMQRWGGRPMLRSGGLMRRPSHPSVPKPETKQGMSGLDIARARRQERLMQLQAEAEQQRQAAEQAKKEREQEKKERELAAEERRAQLEQLMRIHEELRRQREQKQREQNNKK